jgi:hypothetical protein
VLVPPATAWADRELWNHDVANARVRDPLNFLLYFRPTVMLRQTASQVIAHATWVPINWDVQEIDNEEMHTVAAGLSRITPRTPGIYKGWMGVSFITSDSTAGSTGERAISLWKNGAETEWGGDFPAPRTGLPSLATQVYKGIPFYAEMNGTTDYLEMIVAQDNASSIGMSTVVTGVEEMPEFFMRWWRRA